MTEAEWDSCTSPRAMLNALRGKSGNRKPLLFACACCRESWHRLVSEAARAGVEVTEKYLDGYAGEPAVIRAFEATRQAEVWRFGWAEEAAWTVMIGALEAGPSCAAGMPARSATAGMRAAKRAAELTAKAAGSDASGKERRHRERAAAESQAAFVGCIFGSPFRPVVVDPAWLAWREGTVGRLALGAYDLRGLPSGRLANARLFVLADALEEAGCADPHLLAHLRSPGPHVRGCHALDAILRRE